ncbi:MAG: hypothetical protein B6244_14840 [Candidatus Cloacimonetes bacterium 4572_55]|nr:MAG: hypothetical protein B6244_14840 [Candidatus Cloacimonetes bacterium 4572_55]
MKIITLDQITGVLASSENPAYPDDNVLDNFRGVPWKSNVSAASTLVLDVSANSNALMLSNMNSGTIGVEIKDSGASTIYGPTNHTIDLNNPNLWVDYDLESGTAEITLTFSDPGTAVPYCGIARAGYAHDFPAFKYGLSEGFNDLSISKTYNNGADYYYFISMLRQFSGSFLVERDDDFYTFMYSIIRKYGRGPYAMKLTDLSNYDWAVFGWMDTSLPKGSHGFFSHSDISVSIGEGL